MPGPKITLYVDIISPFGYLAYYMLRVSLSLVFFRFSTIPVYCQ